MSDAPACAECARRDEREKVLLAFAETAHRKLAEVLRDVDAHSAVAKIRLNAIDEVPKGRA